MSAAGQDVDAVDDQRVGSMLRAAGLRRGLGQHDLARVAGVSASTVSRVERGSLGSTALETTRRVAHALDIRLDLQPRSWAADLDRLVHQRHAARAEHVVGRLEAAGWIVRPEVPFSVYGERGIIDLLAWHEASRAALVIELKTEIVDVGELLGTLDRKRRLGARVARSVGWDASRVGTWLIDAESMTNRRRVAAHARTFRSVLPSDGRAVRRWLRMPSGELAALSFVTDRQSVNVRSAFATLRRVPTRRGTGGRTHASGDSGAVSAMQRRERAQS